MYRGCRDKISINISELQRKLEKNKQNILEAKHKIALLHHHLIGVEEGDATSVQNAIPLLQLLEEYDFEDDEDYDDEYEYENEDEDEEDEREDI